MSEHTTSLLRHTLEVTAKPVKGHITPQDGGLQSPERCRLCPYLRSCNEFVTLIHPHLFLFTSTTPEVSGILIKTELVI